MTSGQELGKVQFIGQTELRSEVVFDNNRSCQEEQMVPMNANFFAKFFSDIDQVVRSVDTDILGRSVDLIEEAIQRKGKVIIVGNGGSASMASHIAVDLTKNARTRAVNFNEADLLTCLANDYGYENWVSKAIEFYADPVDIAVLISSSGSSKNILNGAVTARQKGLKLITFSGFKPENPLRQMGDINFFAESEVYNVVEMAHHIWLVSLVDRIVCRI